MRPGLGLSNGEIIMRYALCIVAGLLASCSAGNPPRHYVDIINNSTDSVVSMNAAVPGSNAWKPLRLRGVVDGGYIGQTTVAIPGDHGCVYDVLVEFAHQRPLLISAMNACRSHRLDVGHAWRQAYSQRR
jgi:hypothetical protein